jgi:hypothetical protein
MKPALAIALALACILLTQSTAAEVADSASSGFTLKITLNVHATPGDVYRHLVNVGDWWEPTHTFSGDAQNLTLEDKAAGCWCEKLPGGGSVRHMEVIMVKPGKLLRLSGMLGPMQPLGASGTMSIELTPTEGGTRIDVQYAVGGYLPAGWHTFAAPVDSVLTLQFTRLKNYAETGDPSGKSQK